MIQQLAQEHYVMLEKKLEEKLPFSFAVIFQRICTFNLIHSKIWNLTLSI